MPVDFVPEELFTMDVTDHDQVLSKDIAWSLARLDLSDLNDIKPACENPNIPSWSGFNSVITDENLSQKVIGFLPVIPHPVTDYSTVYTEMKNFQNILSQLQQSHLAITADEGVDHIAHEIQLQHPDEFKDLIFNMGSLHIIKVVLGCIESMLTGAVQKKYG